MAARGVALNGTMSAGRISFERVERNMLLLTAFGLWIAIYVKLNVGWLSPPVDHQTERAMRRIVTCAAGAGLCLAIVPVLVRASLEPLGKRLWIAAGASLGAYLAHFCVRLGVFHLYDPIWGPLSPQVVREGLGAAGWMFPLWSAVCLVVLGEARRRHGAHPEPETGQLPACAREVAVPDSVWCMKGSRRVCVSLADIFLFAAERDYVRLHTREHQYLVLGRLKDWADVLPDDEFMQVHRSAIVRLNAVAGIERTGTVWRIELPDGSHALVSRPKAKEFRRRLAESNSVGRARS